MPESLAPAVRAPGIAAGFPERMRASGNTLVVVLKAGQPCLT
jgi:hypothetical protein